ncbi:MAG: ornithine carbamoyltransferase, partial [Anaerolineae bacterium]
IGDGNNVAHSLLLMAAKLGTTMVVGTPEGYRPAPSIMDRARTIAAETGATILWTADPVEAAREADMIYTDTWTSMGQEDEAEQRRKVFPPYQVNYPLLQMAPAHTIVMHCLPAHRGEEITDSVADGPQSRLFPQAENRLHAQKAILVQLLR